MSCLELFFIRTVFKCRWEIMISIATLASQIYLRVTQTSSIKRFPELDVVR